MRFSLGFGAVPAGRCAELLSAPSAFRAAPGVRRERPRDPRYYQRERGLRGPAIHVVVRSCHGSDVPRERREGTGQRPPFRAARARGKEQGQGHEKGRPLRARPYKLLFCFL